MITNSAGFNGAKPPQYIHDALVDIVLRGGFLITFYQVSVYWRSAPEGALPEEVMHECADVQSYLRP